ncbi:MAG TPA: phosphoglycerate mutase family protein [Bdellovibrionales bacterium]|jgi:broad specificity phosphatase PhoE|nr:phosphoglycerate mutase family protein [Bdellovibrionales bacterium]
MKLVLFRHATRSPYEVGDASLNTVGLAQANDLPSLVTPHGSLPSPTHLFSSPKKRARQTLQVLSDNLGLALIIDENLDERKNNESTAEFDQRVMDVFDRLMRLDHDATAYVCSHLDWLEAAIAKWPSDYTQSATSWAAGEFLIFRVEDGVCITKGGGVISPRRA